MKKGFGPMKGLPDVLNLPSVESYLAALQGVSLTHLIDVIFDVVYYLP